MEKTWYIKIKGKQKGPYTLRQLKYNLQITPETLVWNPQLSAWVPLRSILELLEIFKDPEPLKDITQDLNQTVEHSSSTLILELQREPPPFIWILLIAILMLLILIQI